jgi:hypothetical protein
MLILNTELFDDLKCCGNCKHRDSSYSDGNSVEYCYLNDSGHASWQVCKQWEYDNLKKADRMV